MTALTPILLFLYAIGLICLFICLPCIVLGRITESRRQTVRRLSHQGLSQRAIAARLQITRSQVRRHLAK